MGRSLSHRTRCALGSLLLITTCLVTHSVAANLPGGWLTDYDQALAAGKDQEKHILAVFSTSWCGPCQMMVQKIYPEQSVRDELEKEWIAVYVDGDKHQELVKKLSVNAYPTLLYISPDGKEVNRSLGAAADPAAFIELLRTKGESGSSGTTESPFDRNMAKLEKLIEAKPNDVDLRRRRVDLIIKNGLEDATVETLKIGRDDLLMMARQAGQTGADPEQQRRVIQEYQLFQLLMQMEADPTAVDQHHFDAQIRSLVQSGDLDESMKDAIYALLAIRAMDRADYSNSARYMRQYLDMSPSGDYVERFALLLPQVKGFAELMPKRPSAAELQRLRLIQQSGSSVRMIPSISPASRGSIDLSFQRAAPYTSQPRAVVPQRAGRASVIPFSPPTSKGQSARIRGDKKNVADSLFGKPSAEPGRKDTVVNDSPGTN